MVTKWETISEREINDLKIFKAEIVRRRHPVWGREAEFTRLNSKNWANVVPVTKNNEILLIEQYRQGSDSITLEIPGGLIELNEDPKEAAKRECIEETGFISDEELIPIGICLPNPAFLNNKCYSYAWLGMEHKLEQNFDLNEEIRVVPTPVSEVKEMIMNGKIDHSIIITAFHYFFSKFKINE